jgi:hypothetical protein
MTASGGSPAEMFILPGDADRLSPDETTAERLLSGDGAGPDAPPDAQALALVLEAAAQPAMPRELAGEQAAVAAFERAVASRRRRRVTSHRPVTRRRHIARHGHASRHGDGLGAWLPLARRIPVLVSGGALAMAAVFGGAAAADGLPTPLQNVAHSVFDAPAPHRAASAPSAPQPAPESNVQGPAASVRRPQAPGAAANPKPDSKTKAEGKAMGDGKAKADGKTKAPAKTKATAKAKAPLKAHGHEKADGQGTPPGGDGTGNGHDKVEYKAWPSPKPVN